MDITTKVMLKHPMQLFKIATLLVMVSVPLISITMTDYLSYAAFFNTDNHNRFEFQMSPYEEEIFNETDTLTAQMSTLGFCKDIEIFYLTLVSSEVTTSSTNIASNLLLVGLSNLETISGNLDNDSIGILDTDAAMYNLSISDSLNISGWSPSYLPIGAVVDVPTETIGQIKGIFSRFGRPTNYFSLYGNIATIRGLAVKHNIVGDESDIGRFLHIKGNLELSEANGSTIPEIETSIESDLSGIESIINPYGTTGRAWTPLDTLEVIEREYALLDRDTLVIIWPAIMLSILFLYLALWTMTLMRRGDFSLLSIRGARRSQIIHAVLVTDIIVAVVGGLLSIPFGALVSILILGASSTWNGFAWLIFVFQEPLLLIIGVTTFSFIAVFGVTYSTLSIVKTSRSIQGMNDIVSSAFKRMGNYSAILFLLIPIIVLVDTVLNFPLLNLIVSTGQASPSFQIVGILLMYLNLFLIFLSPLMIGYSISMLSYRWHPLIFQQLIKVKNRFSDASRLLAKGLSMPEKRRAIISALLLLSIFFSTFIAVYFETRSQITYTNSILTTGGDIKITINGSQNNMESIMNNISSIPDIYLMSSCASAFISIKSNSTFFQPSNLFIIDDEYLNRSSCRMRVLDVQNIPQNTILVSRGFSDFAEIGDNVTVRWNFQNSSSIPVGDLFNFIPGFQDTILQYQVEGTSYVTVISESYLHELHGTPRIHKQFLFIEVQDNFVTTLSNIETMLEYLTSIGDLSDYYIDSMNSDTSSNRIQNTYIAIMIIYQTIIGSIGIAMVIILTLNETRKHIRISRIRGASNNQILRTVMVYYFTHIVPLIFGGIILSEIYAYGFLIAPIILEWNLSFGISNLILPVSYSVVLPISAILTNLLLMAITLFVAFIMTKHVLKQLVLEGKYN